MWRPNEPVPQKFIDILNDEESAGEDEDGFVEEELDIEVTYLIGNFRDMCSSVYFYWFYTALQCPWVKKCFLFYRLCLYSSRTPLEVYTWWGPVAMPPR